MGSRVGSAVGAVMDTKNKVRDSASSLKENVKDLPTQAGYAVHSAKQKAKDNVSDLYLIHILVEALDSVDELEEKGRYALCNNVMFKL